MKNFDDVSKVKEDQFIKSLKYAAKSPTPLFVICNNISSLIGLVKGVSDEMKEYETFLQPNPNFSGDLKEFVTYDYLKKQFEDYCNYFDKHRITQVIYVNKRLFNYSREMEELKLVDYPDNKRMLLIVENLNFWDKNSQYYIGQITEKNNNIITIGQIRSDFDFAATHIDSEIALGVRGKWMFLEE
ncbi:MAG: hypothetical protein JXB49_31315 [Bacteroidales bacterium]|nr:hypothetical protein [Bacteroidales bacterium]